MQNLQINGKIRRVLKELDTNNKSPYIDVINEYGNLLKEFENKCKNIDDTHDEDTHRAMVFRSTIFKQFVNILIYLDKDIHFDLLYDNIHIIHDDIDVYLDSFKFSREQLCKFSKKYITFISTKVKSKNNINTLIESIELMFNGKVTNSNVLSLSNILFTKFISNILATQDISFMKSNLIVIAKQFNITKSIVDNPILDLKDKLTILRKTLHSTNDILECVQDGSWEELQIITTHYLLAKLPKRLVTPAQRLFILTRYLQRFTLLINRDNEKTAHIVKLTLRDFIKSILLHEELTDSATSLTTLLTYHSVLGLSKDDDLILDIIYKIANGYTTEYNKHTSKRITKRITIRTLKDMGITSPGLLSNLKLMVGSEDIDIIWFINKNTKSFSEN